MKSRSQRWLSYFISIETRLTTGIPTPSPAEHTYILSPNEMIRFSYDGKMKPPLFHCTVRKLISGILSRCKTKKIHVPVGGHND